ncbi:MotA/TolQ/ExbB proton channel family protein [Chlamydiota bacterium]
MSGGLLFSFMHAGFIGKLVLLGLFFISIYAWGIVVQKYKQLKYAEIKNKKFLSLFHQKKDDIFTLYNEIRNKKSDTVPLLDIFKRGAMEVGNLLGVLKQNPGVITAPEREEKISILEVENLEKILFRVVSEQVIHLEKSTVFLATTAGISPLLGLFGTVWGVMNSFRSMASQGSASIGTVAPGISEALITTVAGLFVAIPALIFYNWFRNRITVMTIQMENFCGEFISAIHTNYLRK